MVVELEEGKLQVQLEVQKEWWSKTEVGTCKDQPHQELAKVPYLADLEACTEWGPRHREFQQEELGLVQLENKLGTVHLVGQRVAHLEEFDWCGPMDHLEGEADQDQKIVAVEDQEGD